MNRVRAGLGMLSLLVVPAVASAQNNTVGAAATYSPTQGWIRVDVGAAPIDQRWYRYGVVAGRSYCAEEVASNQPTATEDGLVEVYRQDGTTLIARGDDIQSTVNNGQGPDIGYDNEEPTPGRACYIAPATENNYAKVGNFNFGSAAQTYQFRVVETTLYSPWFFSGSGFEAFILLRNTVAVPVNATVTLRNTAGAVLGTPRSTTVLPNGSFNLQVSAAPPNGFGLAAASGSVEVAFGGVGPASNGLNNSAGAPGSLLGNVTSLSFGQGVSFDTPMAPRQDWLR
jgi:hypothetical protein